MSVEVQYVGRLGNQLFQYAFGRIIAEKLGYELRCIVVNDKVKNSSFLGRPLDSGGVATLPELTSYFKNAPQFLPGKRVAAPEERFLVDEQWDGHRIDLEGLVSDRRDRRLVFRGFFQRFDYYRDYRAQLKEWFALEPLVEEYGITRRDILVNIRRGWDYALSDWVLSLSAYTRLLAQVPHDRLFVCGTGIDDGVREALAPFSPIYYRSAPIDEFRFIMKFDQIIQSNSTFCWWASFLSEATAVYTPRPDRGYLSKDMGGDALNTGEERYRLFEARVERFIPFQPNPEATLKLEKDALIIESPVAGVAKIPCAPPSLPFYRWLVERRDPFGMEDLAQRGLKVRRQIERLIGPLVEKGAVLIKERFH